MNAKTPILLLALLGAQIFAPACAQNETDDDWPGDENAAITVNEGKLEFIVSGDTGDILHAHTELRLDADSISSGWVEMRQCYRQLDAVDKTEIVYSYRELRELRVTQASNIGKTRVAGQGVVLETVLADAVICVAAGVRILERLSATAFRLRNGPYHRRFLDGYYPYRVSLLLFYEAAGLTLKSISPAAQPGFDLTPIPGGARIDSLFEGVLRITIDLEDSSR